MQEQDFHTAPLPPLSATLERLAMHIGPDTHVIAEDLISDLLNMHPEYAHNIAGKIAESEQLPTTTESLSTAEWLWKIWQLYDPSKIERLDGKLFIAGVLEISPDLQDYLDKFGFTRALIEEIEKQHNTSFHDLLAQASDPAQHVGTDPQTASASVPDPTVLHDDTPTLQDQLGRDAFAEALATWLSRFWQNSREKDGHSFIMHLHGTWGSGKTSLLRLLENWLRPRAKKDVPPESEKPEWIVVWYNAWRNQHLKPSWWSLIDTIYKNAHAQLLAQGKIAQAKAIKRLNRKWRYRSGENAFRYAFYFSLAVFLFLLLVALNLPAGDNSTTLTAIANLSKPVLTIISFLTTIGSGIMVLRNNLFTGGASSALNFMQRTPDPMQNVRKHFKAMAEAIGQPVMVFIDDLDRCRKEYVVRLLEEIQTLYNHSAVYYTIAADRRWLYVCFESEYEIFRESIREPGRRLGYLFLEKAFQLSIAIPHMSPAIQQAFLDYLYRGSAADINRKLQTEKEAAEQEFAGITTQDELLALLQQSSGDTLENQARREAAVRRSAHESIEKATTFYLQKFATLLEPNPRAMKRLVNAYGIYRALAILSRPHLLYDPDMRDQFVLWTILSMRWPLLQEYLREHPEKVILLQGGLTEDDMPAEIIKLANSPQVRDVLNGGNACTPLSPDALQDFIALAPEVGHAATSA